MKKTMRNQTGFTLLELLIATLISVIVVSAVMEVFATNYKSYLLQEDIANMQENLRVGMIFLDRDVAMIGSGMIGVDKPGGFNIMKISGGNLIQEQAFPLTFQNNAGGLPAGTVCGSVPAAGTGGSDRLIIRYNNISEGSCGNPPSGITQWACDMLPQITLMGTMPPSSPVAQIKEALAYNNQKSTTFPCNDPDDGSCYSQYPQWSLGCWCNGHLYPPTGNNNYGFFALITSPDNSQSDVFAVTQIMGFSGANPPGASNHLQNSKYLGLENKVVNNYPDNSKITFFTMRTYKEVMYYVQDNNLRRRITTWPDPGDFLENSTTNSGPNCSNDQPIAENVDDLQFAFGLDTDTDGIVDQWINNRNLTDAESLQVRLVRISLLGRAKKPNSTFHTGVRHTIQAATGSASDTLEDRAVSDIEALAPTVAQKDRFYARKMLQTTVKVRNLGL